MRKIVVLYPGLGVGHLVPMVELAKVFLKHGVAVIMALVAPEVESTDFSAAVARAEASNPSIDFHVLPPPPPAPAPADSSNSAHFVTKIFKFLTAMNAPLRDFLRSLPSVDALILDMFCADAQDVAAELKLPVYYFYASGAADLAVSLNLPSKVAGNSEKMKELGDSVIIFPGAPPFKASDLPSEITSGGEAFHAIIGMFDQMSRANGILVNSFDSLETRAVRALRDGLCVPGRATPLVYCIGPLVSGGGGDKEHDECIRWLDTQPDKSVVFLSFGSLGTFAAKQLAEIAAGLEKSGERFLWVVRSPRGPDFKYGDSQPEPDLDALLPDGFLERTKGRGLVVKNWAPQVEVLSHRATGAFITHCGWNSTLEGITAGLPLLCWPMYAEQRMNKVHIVEEMKLGVEMRGYNEEVVMAEEVEEKVRWVMTSEGGKTLRERVAAAKNGAAEALKEGGSSHLAFVQFLKDLDTAIVQD